MEEVTVPKVSRERMLEWLEQARRVGAWPASLDDQGGKFEETYRALAEMVEKSSLRITVVHTGRVEP